MPAGINFAANQAQTPGDLEMAVRSRGRDLSLDFSKFQGAGEGRGVKGRADGLKSSCPPLKDFFSVKQVVLPLLHEVSQFRLILLADLPGILAASNSLQNFPGADHTQGVAEVELSRIKIVQS
jgi:hypothetical protein